MKYLFPIIAVFLVLSCDRKELLPIQFYKQEMFIKVNTEEVYVEGIYYYRNRTEIAKQMTLFYPFPVDSLHHFPHGIEVEGTDYEIVMPEEELPSLLRERIEDVLDIMMPGITYDVVIQPMDTAISIVRYRQKIETNSAKYILITARKWREPIKEARFIISIPEEFREVSISYQPDSIKKKEGRVFWYITEHELFPEKDIDISWKALPGR